MLFGQGKATAQRAALLSLATLAGHGLILCRSHGLATTGALELAANAVHMGHNNKSTEQPPLL